MADQIILTPQPIRLAATGKQALAAAVEVSDYPKLVLQIVVPALEGTSSPTATIRIITSNQKETEDGWTVVGTFSTVNAAAFSDVIEITKHVKYIRWEVSGLTGTAPAVTFMIAGYGRDAF